MTIKAVVFDMDGVVTQTATVHFQAWKKVFDSLLLQIKNQEKNQPFSEDDYFHYLDGMPRIDGVKNFLISREITAEKLPEQYLTLDECINSICETKNKLFLSYLDAGCVSFFPDTIEFIQFLHQHNYKTAIISSSKNCKAILKNANIEHLFSVRVDGEISEKIGLPGKPNPAIFLEAARQLNLLPEECMIVEDALAGVQAGKEGGFGLVVALDRKGCLKEKFIQLGADYVLTDLSAMQKELYNGFSYPQEKLSAFTVLPLLSDAIKQKKEIIIFLDYDGTLTPIVDRPEIANLSQEMYQCLLRIGDSFTTVIISGRELENLKKKVNIPTLSYAGNHGFEFETNQFDVSGFQKGHEFKDTINSLYYELEQKLKNIKGCLIENKKFSLSVHYRLVEEKFHNYISCVIDYKIKKYSNLVRHYGKMVFEIRPNIKWNKGIACYNFLNKIKQIKQKKQNILPIYIGDDLTDEDAFNRLNFNGITIKVSNSPCNTSARFILKSPVEVEMFLLKLINYKDSKNESMDCKLQML